MVTIENLSYAYSKSKKAILDRFSLEIEKGKIYGLLGKNGVGKSTLLYLMTGLLTPRSGRVLIHDINVRKRLPATLKDVFLVPEEFELPAVSLISYVELNSPFYPNFSKEDLVQYLHCFEMELDVHLAALSMGQKKKVFMSFALATNTSLLIMDEPTNGLDIPGKSQFRKFITAGMTDNKTIIISTHQVRDVDRLLDHILIMGDNEILLNEATYRISEKLLFVESDNRELVPRALCVMPSIQGNYLLMPNEEGQDSEINLELLFTGMLSNAEQIRKVIHS